MTSDSHSAAPALDTGNSDGSHLTAMTGEPQASFDAHLAGDGGAAAPKAAPDWKPGYYAAIARKKATAGRATAVRAGAFDGHADVRSGNETAAPAPSANSLNSADTHRAGVGAECETAAAMNTFWRVCRVCGVYEPCCLRERGAMCVFDDAGDPPTPSDDAHLAGEECRRARDGNWYTLKEFLEKYGDRRGADYWNSADIHRAADERSGPSD